MENNEEKSAVEYLIRNLIHKPNWVQRKIIKHAKQIENLNLINFARFRDDFFEKADKFEDFTISDKELIEKYKETFKSE